MAIQRQGGHLWQKASADAAERQASNGGKLCISPRRTVRMWFLAQTGSSSRCKTSKGIGPLGVWDLGVVVLLFDMDTKEHDDVPGKDDFDGDVTAPQIVVDEHVGSPSSARHFEPNGGFQLVMGVPQ